MLLIDSTITTTLKNTEAKDSLYEVKGGVVYIQRRFFFFIILILCKVNSGPICRVQMVSNPDFHASDLEFKSRWNLHFFSSKIAAEVPFLC